MTVRRISDSTITDLISPSDLPAGSILQIVSSTKTDTYAIASIDVENNIPGLAVTITPSSATSKIFLLVNINITATSIDGTTRQAHVRLNRNGTPVVRGDAAGSRARVFVGNQMNANSPAMNMATWEHGGHYLDSPASTSALTYQLTLQGTSNGNAFVNRSGTDSDSGVWARPVSSITAMEVAA